MTAEVDQPILNLDELGEGDRVYLVRKSKTLAWHCGVWEVKRVYRHIRAIVVERNKTRVFVREGDPTLNVWSQGVVEKRLW